MGKLFLIRKDDAVAVALHPVIKGETETVGGITVTAANDIPQGHKIALKEIAEGEPVIKYGYSIGNAKCDIKVGEHVHTHNVKTALTAHEAYTYNPVQPANLKAGEELTFKGYVRENGKVGVRNEVWVIPTVGCVAAIAAKISENAQKYKTDNIDAIVHFSHPFGCSQLGEDHKNTQRALCGMINHPNAAAVLVLGLGCENNTLEQMQSMLGSWDDNRVKFLVCQDVQDEFSAADKLMSELCEYANGFTREEVPASKLVLGMKCGGSDGLSGITANPLVGMVCDRLVATGGSVMLTEVPEMFGAERVLMNRCKDEATFNKTVDLINNFKDYFGRYGEGVGENPSPGNKAGGITTLEDKSLGCIQKGGFATVNDVLSYGEPIKEKGLSLLQAPGNDLVASCALSFSGAQIVLFTTGRGTPFAGPVPTVKISSNTPLFNNKNSWIDFNAGSLVDGADWDTLADEFFRYILDVASGKPVKSEKLCKSELAIFKDGVVL